MILVWLLVDCTRCSEYFVQCFEAWTWLVYMLVCVRLCVTLRQDRFFLCRFSFILLPFKSFSFLFLFFSSSFTCASFILCCRNEGRSSFHCVIYLWSLCPFIQITQHGVIQQRPERMESYTCTRELWITCACNGEPSALRMHICPAVICRSSASQ